jgi:hypothetical protein
MVIIRFAHIGYHFEQMGLSGFNSILVPQRIQNPVFPLFYDVDFVALLIA